MREMKDSGVEWIGEIPEDWQICRIKFVADFDPSCNKKAIDGNSLITYTPMECIKHGFFINRAVPLNRLSSSLTPYKEGDIVMAKVTPCFENGNIAVMSGLHNGFGMGSSELFVFRPRRIQTQYLFYWLQNSAFIQKAKSTMTGTGGLKRVSSAFVKTCPIHLPPTEAQIKIASFLDFKCSQVDALISNVQAQIEKLKAYKQSLITEVVTKGLDPAVPMKDSGVEWIGEIPEHWSIRKANTISQRIVVGVVIRPSEYFDVNGTIPFLRGMNVKDYRIDTDSLIYITEQSNEILSKSIVHKGDILIVRDGNIGASCIVPPELDGSNVVSMIIFTPNAECTSSYICYCLNSRIGKNQFELTKIGSALTHTSVSAVSRLLFPLPQIEEQNCITEYLDKKSTQIDRLIAIKQEKITKLEQYKRSLICEYVTGKKMAS